MRELYINDKLVDIDEKTAITIQFKSFLFTGIGSIDGFRTWSVSLPMTRNNTSVINMAHVAGVNTDFPYKYQKCEYFVNSIPIITNGIAMLISVGDRIEISITFGNGFEKLKQLDGVTLDKLGEKFERSVFWNRLGSKDAGRFEDMYEDVFFPYPKKPKTYAGDLPFFQNKEDVFTENSVQLPCMVVYNLLDYVAKYAGLNLSLTQSDKDKLKKLAIPLNNANKTRNGYLLSSTISETKNAHRFMHGILVCEILTSSALQSSCFVLGKENSVTKIQKGANLEYVEISGDLISDTLSAYADFPDLFTSAHVIIDDIVHDLTVIKKKEQIITTSIPPLKRVTITVYGKIYGSKFDDMFFGIKRNLVQTGAIQGILGANITIKTNTFSPICDATPYEYLMNLPKKPMLDIILFSQQYIGKFPFINNNTLSFEGTGEVKTNIETGKFLDWSKKTVKTNSQSVYSNASFRFGSYAQKNAMKWSNDDNDVEYITINDDSIQEEGDLFTIKEEKAKLYEDTDLLDNICFNAESLPAPNYPNLQVSRTGYTIPEPLNKNRLIIASITGSSANLNLSVDVGDNILMKTIRNFQSYSNYQQSINNPKLIEEKVLLSALDVYKLDMRVPVYLSQYGKYYAIMELQWSEKGISKVKLLEL